MVYDEFIPGVTDYRISVIKCAIGGRGEIANKEFCGEGDVVKVELDMIKYTRECAEKETDKNVSVYSVSVEKIKDVGKDMWGDSDYCCEKVISTYNAYCG